MTTLIKIEELFLLGCPSSYSQLKIVWWIYPAFFARISVWSVISQVRAWVLFSQFMHHKALSVSYVRGWFFSKQSGLMLTGLILFRGIAAWTMPWIWSQEFVRSRTLTSE
jgi:hypothetical protein